MGKGTLSLSRQTQTPGIYVAYIDTLLANKTEITLWSKHYYEEFQLYDLKQTNEKCYTE